MIDSIDEMMEDIGIVNSKENICPGCDAIYIPKRFDQVYCNWKCSKKNWSKVNKNSRTEKTKEISKKSYYKHREKRIKDNRNWKENNKEKSIKSGKNTRLKRQFGITLEQYDNIKLSQKGLCAICNNPPGKKDLCVDHDHLSGRVRELLCGNCNTLLGKCKENTNVLDNAIKYIIKWNTIITEINSSEN